MANDKVISSQALIELFEQALTDKWGYIWGTAGIVWNQSKQTQKVNYMKSKYGDNWQKNADAKNDHYYMAALYGSKWIGHTVADCSGMFVWAFKQYGMEMSHISTTIYVSYCDKKGKLDEDLKKKILPGCAVFTGDTATNHPHVGLYIGNGKVIEAHGTQAGVVCSNLSETRWRWYGQLKNVEYSGIQPEPTPVTKPTIKKGSTGPYVVECQEDLIKLGYDVGKTGADGKFGANTEKAVKEFQKAHDGPDGRALKVDGIVGENTWWALDAAIGPQPGPEPEQKYTVTIPGVTKEQAEELCKTWSGATMTPE